MEAIEFLKEYRRMCKSRTGCIGCPLEKTGCSIPDSTVERLQEIIRVTEQWNKEHPVMTNAQKFEEVFGFNPADFKTLFCFNKSHDGKKLIWWDEPYKEQTK